MAQQMSRKDEGPINLGGETQEAPKNYWCVFRQVSLDDLETTLNHMSRDGYALYRLDEKTELGDGRTLEVYFNIIGCVPGCLARS
jgi:hypothetical protein